MATIVSSSHSSPLSSVMICWNTLATTLNMSFRDRLNWLSWYLLLGAWSQIYVTTEGQSTSLASYQVPSGAQDQIFVTARHLMWGALYDDRVGLSFAIIAGSRQRSHFRVLVPRDSWPYIITAPDSTLPQSEGPSPRIYVPQEQSDPVLPLGTGFHFRRLLRLAGLGWGYLNPPSDGLFPQESELTTSFKCLYRTSLRTPLHVAVTFSTTQSTRQGNKSLPACNEAVAEPQTMSCFEGAPSFFAACSAEVEADMMHSG
jgi:hypothetical protein